MFNIPVFNTVLRVTERRYRYLTGPVMHNTGVYIVMPGLQQLTTAFLTARFDV